MSTFLQLEYREIEGTKLFFSEDLWGEGWKNGNIPNSKHLDTINIKHNPNNQRSS
jgi:hypothetical protein